MKIYNLTGFIKFQDGAIIHTIPKGKMLFKITDNNTLWVLPLGEAETRAGIPTIEIKCNTVDFPATGYNSTTLEALLRGYDIVTNAVGDVNLAEVDGTTVSTDAGTTDAGTQRSVTASDSPEIPLITTLIARVEELEGGYVTLLGKSSGGDFTTSYNDGTSLDCDDLPTIHPVLIAADIEKVIQISNTGERTEYTPGEYVMLVTNPAGTTYRITITGVTFAGTDTFVVYTNVSREATTDTVPGDGLGRLYFDPNNTKGHGKTTRTGADTFTITGAPETLHTGNILQIQRYNSSNVFQETITQKTHPVTITGTTVTVTGMTSSAGDLFYVRYEGEERTIDNSSNAQLTSQLNLDSDKSTSPESYTTFTPEDTNYDEGTVIDVDGFNYLNFAFSKTASDADNSYIKVIYLTTDSSAVDYQETYLSAPVGGVTTIQPNIYEVDKGALVNIITISTKGFPYMRIDIAKATDTGTDSTFTTYINKTYI